MLKVSYTFYGDEKEHPSIVEDIKEYGLESCIKENLLDDSLSNIVRDLHSTYGYYYKYAWEASRFDYESNFRISKPSQETMKRYF